MRKLWFAVLPVMHVILAGVWIGHENAMVWPYLPNLQKEEDFERAHPPAASPSEIGWDDSEYRPTYQAVALTTIDPVPTLLAEPHYPFRFVLRGSAHRAPLTTIMMYVLTDHLRLKTRILILDGLLLSLIGIQWFFIGRWLDSRAFADRIRSLILRPPMLISALALVAQIFILVQEADHSNLLDLYPDLIARLCVCVALLVWIWWGLVALWRFALNLRNEVRVEESPQP